MSCVLYAVSQNNNLKYDKDDCEICPKCGAKLYTDDFKYVICKNHKDAEQYRIIGNKACDYIRNIGKGVQ